MITPTAIILGGTGRLGRVICHEFQTKTNLDPRPVGRPASKAGTRIDLSGARCLVVTNRARHSPLYLNVGPATLDEELDLLRWNLETMGRFLDIESDEPLSCVVVSSACVERDDTSASVAYHAHKAALEQAAISMSVRGIHRFNVVRPGTFVKHEPGKEPNRTGEYVFGRVTAADIARVVVWLCRPDSAAINGQVITLDGGRSRIIRS